MPNPIDLTLTTRSQVHIGRDAVANQRVTFECTDVAFRLEVRHQIGPTQKHIIHLEPGVWTVTHEFKLHSDFSEWTFGKGKAINDRILYFDDGGDGEGDYDFNDIIVRAYYHYNDNNGEYEDYDIEWLKGHADLSYKSPQ